MWGYAMGANPSMELRGGTAVSAGTTTTRRVRMSGPLAISGQGLVVSLQTETAEALDMLDNQVINGTLGSTNWSPTVVMPVNQTRATGLGARRYCWRTILALWVHRWTTNRSGQSSGAVHVLEVSGACGPVGLTGGDGACSPRPFRHCWPWTATRWRWVLTRECSFSIDWGST